MSGETPEEPEPCAVVGPDGQDILVDGSLVLAEFDPELLLQIAETLGNPLALLVSKAHLSKAFSEAARNAQGLLKQVNLRYWSRVDAAAVASVASKCSQLLSLRLGPCSDAVVVAVASNCKQLVALELYTPLAMHELYMITDEAVMAVASGCPQLSSFDLSYCYHITDAAVEAVALGCKQLLSLYLRKCHITDVAVVAVASGCKQLSSLDL